VHFPLAHRNVPRGDPLGTRQHPFDLQAFGTGYVELCRFTAQDDYVERVDVSAAGAGMLLVLDGPLVMAQLYAPGNRSGLGVGAQQTIPVHAFMAEGSDVTVIFQTYSAGHVHGAVWVAPAMDVGLRVARKVFGLEKGYTEEQLAKAYKNLVLENHPDRGGDNQQMAFINFLRDVLKSSLERAP
jgi:hypothetical protein